MRIILCHSILKREINPLLEYFSKGDIKKYVEKAERGLATEIKGSTIPNTKIVKVYMTGRGGAGRMIVLIYVKRDYYLPALVRLKKDKIVGMNLSKGNQAFQDLLNKNLSLIVQDLGEGNFDEL
ncbi:MAG: hypothetical protein WC651_04610 [Candidatus Gracilibacteria bacterium]|jgi:hypothetical protein